MKFKIAFLVRTNTPEQVLGGSPTKEIIDEAIIIASSDNMIIGGYGTNDKYYQFDTCEAYYADEFFQEKNCGLSVVIIDKDINTDADEAKILAGKN